MDSDEDILDLYNVNDNMLDIPNFSPKNRKSRVNLFALSPSEQTKSGTRTSLGAKPRKANDDFFITPSKSLRVDKENQEDNIMFRSPSVVPKKNTLQEVFQAVSHEHATPVYTETRSTTSTPKGSGVYQNELVKPSKLKMPSPSPARKMKETMDLNNTISHIPSELNYSFTSPSNEPLSASFHHEPSASSAYISRLRSLTAEINPSLPNPHHSLNSTANFSTMSQSDKEAQLEVIKQRLSQLKRTAMEVSTIIPTAEPRKHKLLQTSTSATTERVTAQKTSVDATPNSVIKSNSSLSQTMRLNSSLRATSHSDFEVPASARLNRTITAGSLRGLVSKPKVENTAVKRPAKEVAKPHVEVTRSAVKPTSSYSVVKQSIPQTATVQRTVPKTSALSKTTKVEAAPKTTSAIPSAIPKLSATTKEKRPLSLKETFDAASKKHKSDC